MIEIEHIIRKVADRRDEYAKVALTRPSGSSAYDYGKAVGMYTGFDKVIELINEMLEQEDKDEEAEQ